MRIRNENLRKVAFQLKSLHQPRIEISSLSLRTFNMTSCEHIVWLQTVNIKKLQFWEGGWMKQVIQKMLNLIAQYSSLIFFVSQKVKNIALCELFSYNNIKWGHCDGFINLWIDNVTIHSDHSIWFADSDSLLQSTSSSDTAICHESKTYSVCWKPSSEYSMFNIVHA